MLDFNKLAPPKMVATDDMVIGSYYKNKLNKHPNEPLTWGKLKSLFVTPLTTKKDVSPIFVPTLAGGKTKDVIMKYDNETAPAMSCLWVDIDQGSPSLDKLLQLTELLGVCVGIYSSSSAKRIKNGMMQGERWRVVVPISKPITTGEWVIRQKALARHYGGGPEAWRISQPIYLPTNPDGGYYVQRIIDGELLQPGNDPDVVCEYINDIYKEEELEAHKQIAFARLAPVASRSFGGDGGVIDRVNKQYTMSHVLDSYGYQRDGRRYIHPRSESGTAGVIIFEEAGVEYYFSHHINDELADHHRHDVFDVICHWEFGGDYKAAVKHYADTVFTQEEKDRQKQEWLQKKKQEEDRMKITDTEHRGYVPDIESANSLMKTEFSPIRWAIEGLLPEGLAVLSGPPKLGKSWLSLDMCLSIVTGGMAASQFPTEKGSVLLCAMEDNKRRLKTRLQMRAGAGMRMPITGVLDFNLLNDPDLTGLNYTTYWRRLDEGGLDDIRQFLDHNPDCKLVVLDTLAKIKPVAKGKGNAYETDYNDMGELQRLALEKHCCILLITHNRKTETDDPLQSISGSTGITGVMDTILILKRGRSQSLASLYVTGRDVNEHTWALSFDGEHGAWTVTGDYEESKGTNGNDAPLQEEVLQVLQKMFNETGRGAKLKDLFEEMGGATLAPEKSSLSRALGKLERRGQIYKSGTYWIPKN